MHIAPRAFQESTTTGLNYGNFGVRRSAPLLSRTIVTKPAEGAGQPTCEPKRGVGAPHSKSAQEEPPDAHRPTRIPRINDDPGLNYGNFGVRRSAPLLSRTIVTKPAEGAGQPTSEPKRGGAPHSKSTQEEPPDAHRPTRIPRINDDRPELREFWSAALRAAFEPSGRSWVLGLSLYHPCPFITLCRLECRQR